MKQKQIGEYRPNYPKKLIKGAILTTAAAVALAGTAGCTQEVLLGGEPLPEPTDELVLDGEVGIDPGEEDLILEGEPAVDENGDIIKDGEDGSDGREEPALMGKIAVPEETEKP
ncbi:MAG: hypothetical protein II117_05350 [Clostridia bacterium]|nr:hypothetical protein [Clostridia bacterium]